MTLELSPEVATGLAELAARRSQSVEAYLREHVAHELPSPEDTRWIRKDGVLVFTGGEELPPSTIENAVRQMREERDRHVLGWDT